jgi:hypothetical protein
MEQYTLKPGDQLIEAVFATGLTKHFAVYLGMLSDGREWFAENHHLAGGVKLLTRQRYFNAGRHVIRIDRFIGSEMEQNAAINRALKLAGKSYNLLNYNCEHFANEVTQGFPQSRQVTNFFGGLLLFGIISLLARD